MTGNHEPKGNRKQSLMLENVVMKAFIVNFEQFVINMTREAPKDIEMSTARSSGASGQEKITSMRRSQVGTGSRSEKIRTYNYKDNRATDHRLGHNFGLEKVLAGDLEDVIQSCISLDQQERLAELAASTGG